MSYRRAAALTAAAGMLLASLVTGSATAAGRAGTDGGTYVPAQIRKNTLPGYGRVAYAPRRAGRVSAAALPEVGDRRLWPAYDDTQANQPTAGIYFKKYRLRAVSEHLEIWVAADSDAASSGLKYPEGDCRNDDMRRIRISKEQLTYFKRQFERKWYPRETTVFSKPPSRAGNADEAPLFSLIRDLFEVRVPRDNFRGQGQRIVALVDNVRDDQFYDADNANSMARIAGFHYSIFNEMTDRNIMTIDSWDWLHRTTANPPHEPSTDPCSNYPAKPFEYESTFTHEFQHLLEYYADTDGETAWVDEGMADWAQTLTGTARTKPPITDKLYDSHIQCFLGYLEQATDFNPIPAENCGPENSLTLWGDQTDNEKEILADYGAAYSFMLMIVDRYGRDAMTFLHRAERDGFDGLGAMLRNQGAAGSPLDHVHDWLLMMAVDKLLDGGALIHGTTADLEVRTLNAQVDWLNDDAYMTPGAPPNGADYVLARRNNQQYLSAADIDSISFDGADTLPPAPVEWTVDAQAHEGDAALYSGSGDNFDRSIVEQVTVPAGNPTLSFETRYQTEPLYDYGFVQVSTDGGQTWTSLANASTVSDTETGPPISDHLPGLNGTSGGGTDPVWVTENFDLSPYAGRDILLAFRYMTDGGVALPGWWIDNVKVGDTVISDGTDLNEWQTMTQVNPVEVEGFTVQLVAWTNDGQHLYVGRLPLGAGHAGSLEGAALDAVISDNADNVGVIVTYDEPTESINSYAGYTLTVNNFDQPGGE